MNRTCFRRHIHVPPPRKPPKFPPTVEVKLNIRNVELTLELPSGFRVARGQETAAGGDAQARRYDTHERQKEILIMNIHLDISLLQPMIALIAGILILVLPRLLNYVVALYLILLGVSGLWPHLLR